MVLADGLALVCYSYFFPHRHRFMTTFSFAEGRTISIGALRSTFNALCSAEVAAQASYPAVSFHDSPPSPETRLFPYPPAVVFSDATRRL